MSLSNISDSQSSMKKIRFRPPSIKIYTQAELNKDKRITLPEKDPIKFFEEIEGKLNHLLFKRHIDLMRRNGKKSSKDYLEQERGRPSSIEVVHRTKEDIDQSPQKTVIDKFLTALNPNAGKRKAQPIRRKSCHCSECGGMSNLESKTAEINIPNKRTILRENKSITRLLRKQSRSNGNAEVESPTRRKTTIGTNSVIADIAKSLGNRDFISKILNNLKDSKKQIMTTTNLDQNHVTEGDEPQTEGTHSNDCTIFDDKSPTGANRKAIDEQKLKSMLKSKPKLLGIKIGHMFGYKEQRSSQELKPLSTSLASRKYISPEVEREFKENFPTFFSPSVKLTGISSGKKKITIPNSFKYLPTSITSEKNSDSASTKLSMKGQSSDLYNSIKRKIPKIKSTKKSVSEAKIKSTYYVGSSQTLRTPLDTSQSQSITSSSTNVKSTSNNALSSNESRVVLTDLNRNRTPRSKRAKTPFEQVSANAKTLKPQRPAASIKLRPAESENSYQGGKKVGGNSMRITTGAINNTTTLTRSQQSKIILSNLENFCSPKATTGSKTLARSPNFLIKKRTFTPLNNRNGQSSFFNRSSQIGFDSKRDF